MSKKTRAERARAFEEWADHVENRDLELVGGGYGTGAAPMNTRPALTDDEEVRDTLERVRRSAEK